VIQVKFSALEGLKNLGVIESLDIFKRYQETNGDLIELTLLPRARWQTLLHLDVIGVSPIFRHFSI
jgi:hypothetical protein